MRHRARTIVLIGLGAVVLALFVLKAAIPGFLVSEGQHEIVDLGATIDPIISYGSDRADITVTDLTLVSTQERESWDLLGSRWADLADDDIYLIRYTVDNDSQTSFNGYAWRLVDADGAEYAASYATLPVRANCEQLHAGDDGDGCVVVAVKAGAEITMVQYHGVKQPRARYNPGSDSWAGWRV